MKRSDKDVYRCINAYEVDEKLEPLLSQITLSKT